MSKLFHTRLLRELEKNHFPQTCALKMPVKTQSTTGNEKVTHEVRSGYEAIPCRVAPATGGERRTTAYVYSDTTHVILLAGQFGDLASDWVAEVDGQEYDILLPAEDADGLVTHLECRVVK